MMPKVRLAPNWCLAALSSLGACRAERWAEWIHQDKYDGRHVQNLQVRRKIRRLAHRVCIARSAEANGIDPAGAGGEIGFVSQVERDRTTPSITSLLAIAQALEVDIHYFISPPPSSQVVRRASDPELLDMGNAICYERLTGKHGERQMEALLMTIPPKASTPATTRGGEGFYYVLDGKLSVTLGCETFILGNGDSVHFDQRHPYEMANVGNKTLRILWVGTPAIF